MGWRSFTNGRGFAKHIEFGEYNYFTPEDLQTIIGAPANGLQNYHLYGEKENMYEKQK